MTPGCPNAVPLADYLDGLAGVAFVATIVDGRMAMPAGFAGSPTVLIDGANPFGHPAVDAAACALHPPTIADLRRLLEPGPDLS